jgi:hypothetical protein
VPLFPNLPRACESNALSSKSCLIPSPLLPALHPGSRTLNLLPVSVSEQLKKLVRLADEMSALMRAVSIGDNVRLFGWAASNDVEGKSNELCMRPCQGCG